MVKYKIEWSIEAEEDLIKILEYYNERNGNNNYSKKLYAKINKSIISISKRPNIGMQTDYESVRSFIKGEYQIIYEIKSDTILIFMLWDCRRNPEDKKIGKLVSRK